MRTLGNYLLTCAIGSIVLNIFNLEFSPLAWMDMWGEAIGWIIRLGIMSCGAYLLYAAQFEEEQTAENQQ